jgi:SAM-dependent methyltransferase
MTEPEPEAAVCPVCDNTEFGPYSGRERAICTRCKSLERGRLQYMILRELGLPRPGSRILHVAPEAHLFHLFEAASADLYHPADFDPANPHYASLGRRIYEIDLCRDLFRFPSASFDLIVHNHVLEHIPCAVEPVLAEHIRVLAPGGYFVFSVPFRGPDTVEDLSRSLEPAERRARFAQEDHMRVFGTEEFPLLLREVFGTDLAYPAASVWPEEQLRHWAVPPEYARRITGATTFVYCRPEAA